MSAAATKLFPAEDFGAAWSAPSAPILFPIVPSHLPPQMVQAIGARVWSADGAEYVDFDNTGGAVILGHRHPGVVAAVRLARSSDDPYAFDRIRDEVEGRLIDCVPGAEAAVFGADVSQALRAAVSCARHATGRDQAFICRSSAWRSGGRLPTFPFDDLPALERLMAASGGEAAALILAPCDARAPSRGYLQAVRALADHYGALLVFDETLTGFRVHEGGAQALFGVRADLAVFGESLANGMALGALVGSRALIEGAAERLAGELRPDLASLAAARAVLQLIEAEPVVAQLRITGAEIEAELSQRLRAAGVEDVVLLMGDPAASRIGFRPPVGVDAAALKTLWVEECLSHGLHSLDGFNVSYAQGPSEIATALRACEQAADRLALALKRGQFPGASAHPTPWLRAQ